MLVPDFVHGCIAPTFTAFHEDGRLDDDGQRNLLDFMQQSGAISAYFIRSGMGQMYAFQMDDVKHLTRVVCEHLAGKAPVLVGCNGEWERDYSNRPDPETFLRQGIELAQSAAEAGASGVVYTVPEAWVPAANESMGDMTVRYFTRLCESVSLPVFIYQPPNTHKDYLLTPKVLARLAALDKVVGLKASYSDAYYVYNLIRATKDEEFRYICGHEGIYFAALYAGATAVIGQGATITPQILKALQEAYEAGDRDTVLAAQDSTNLLCEECSNPVDFYKAYAADKGYPVKRAFRKYKTNPYGQDPTLMTDEQYRIYRRLVERELEKFGAAAAV
ncbi:MAG: dihydrodipicolinate synthase family protein [Candidatus Hydrogenedentes bacterium]|nr:dihydrodipicolinate synthase family protein [Candidatus Hydrogenedentota bacterium]